MRIIFAFIFLVQTSLFLTGQSAVAADTLTFDAYISIVKNHHPVAYQALLLSDRADGIQRIAKGGFDPKVEGSWDQKAFDGKNYYQLASGAVKIPTWYGIDIKAGYDDNDGLFLNNSDFVPDAGLWNLSVSAPLGRGLKLDERRAELERAGIYRQVTAKEQVLILNELLYDAAIVYIEWQNAHAALSIAQQGVAIAVERLSNVKQSFFNGDKPAIDTLESSITMLSRQQDLMKVQIRNDNARYNLNNYLWIEGRIPLEIVDATNPENGSLWQRDDISVVDSIHLLQDNYIATHPELLLYDYKLNDLDVERRLYREDLKPDIRINYSPLMEGGSALFNELNIGDYKLGVSFSYTLNMRKTRGKLDINNIKTKETNYNLLLKREQLVNKLDAYVNNIRQMRAQYELLTIATERYVALLRAERRKLNIGESSMFLINSREVKYLDSQYKLLELDQNIQEYIYQYLLLTGLLNQVI
jgi:outer membrane protein TolC